MVPCIEGKMTDYQTIHVKADSHMCEVFKQLDEFRSSDEFCDVYLMAAGKQIPAHRVVLAACSPYFRAMFSADFLEARQPTVELKVMDGSALNDLISYFYSGELYITADNVEGLLALSSLLQLEKIVEHCETYMRRNMCHRNCLGLQSIAKYYGLKGLMEQSENYISWYFVDIENEGEFLRLPGGQLQQLLSNDRLKVPSEEFIFEATMKWLLHDIYSRQKYLPGILKQIRFGVMNPNFLSLSPSVRTLRLNAQLGQEFIEQLSPSLSKVKAMPEKYSCPRSSCEDIFVIGGWSNGQKISTVQCFNVNTLEWKIIQQMNVGHAGKQDYFRVVVANEELYTISCNRVLKYDPIDNKWCYCCEGPGIHCKWAGVCDLGVQIYVIGGNTARASKRFDIETLEWTDLAPMHGTRFNPGVDVLGGYVYAVGGLDHRWTPCRTAERYDPRRNVWIEIARMHHARWSFGLAAVSNKLFAIGGSHDVEKYANSVEVYDPEQDIWDRSVPQLNYGRRCLGVAVVDDRIYVVGGRVANTIECYDWREGTWKVISSVNASCNFGCVALRII